MAKGPLTEANDRFELEANRIAEHMTRNADANAINMGQGMSLATTLSSSTVSGVESGQPLPAPIRAYFEPRFGQDLSRVRIHTSDRAAELSQSLEAEAFTYGHDVYFDRNRLVRAGDTGMSLLAHELAHVVQQASTGMPRVQRQAQGKARPPTAVWRIPTKGWYKDVQNNPYGGLPEALYPSTPDDFMSLTSIYMDVDQMDRIQFDAETLQEQGSADRRLSTASPEWASWFVQERVPGSVAPNLGALQAEYEKLRADVPGQISSIKTPMLKEFLSQRIHVLIPPFSRARKLRRSEHFEGKIAPVNGFGPDYLREDRLLRLLLNYPF
ncbi:MAG: DUF4157 domain-containing protein [Terracidiphilus sp.]